MRMKSVLVLAALSAMAFFCRIGYSADSDTAQQSQTTEQTDTVKSVEQSSSVDESKDESKKVGENPTPDQGSSDQSTSDSAVEVDKASSDQDQANPPPREQKKSKKSKGKKSKGKKSKKSKSQKLKKSKKTKSIKRVKPQVKHHARPRQPYDYKLHPAHIFLGPGESAFNYRSGTSCNFLLGGSAAYAIQQEVFTTRFTSPGFIANSLVTSSELRVSDEGVLLGLLAGWQWRCNRLLLGLEGNVDFGSFEKVRGYVFTDFINAGVVADDDGELFNPLATNIYDATVLYDRGDIFAVTARMGYFITSFFLPYVRAGIQFSRDEVSYQVFDNTGTPITSPGEDRTPILLANFISRNKNVWGVVLGIGAEFPLYIGPTSIRFEYNVVRTENVIMEENGPLIWGTHKFRYPQTNIGRVSFIWNFV